MSDAIIRHILYTCLAIGFCIVFYTVFTYDPVKDRNRPLDPNAICQHPEKFPAEWSKDCE